MYSIQSLHIQPNPFLAVIQKVGNTVTSTFDSLGRGLAAAHYAERNPTDKETILRILDGE